MASQIEEMQKKFRDSVAKQNKVIERLEVENRALNEIATSKETELVEYRKQLGISGLEETYTQVTRTEREHNMEVSGEDGSRQPVPMPPSSSSNMRTRQGPARTRGNAEPPEGLNKEKLAQEILATVEKLLHDKLGITTIGMDNRSRSKSKGTRTQTHSRTDQGGNMVPDTINYPPLNSRPQKKKGPQTYSQAAARRGSVPDGREEERRIPKPR